MIIFNLLLASVLISEVLLLEPVSQRNKRFVASYRNTRKGSINDIPQRSKRFVASYRNGRNGSIKVHKREVTSFENNQMQEDKALEQDWKPDSFEQVVKPENYEEILQRAMEEDKLQLRLSKSKPYVKEEVSPIKGRGATPSHKKRWKNKEMMIKIDPKFPEAKQKIIQAAIWTLQIAMGCFKFTIIPPETRIPKGDYLLIKWNPSTEGGCSSPLGREGGKQVITISTRCIPLLGIVMHEVLHSLGFYHEQTRPDRDEYVTINWDNIKEEKWRYQYKIMKDQKLYASHYDFDSIMHYPLNKAMEAKPSKVPKGITPGQRNHLSKSDVRRLKKMYCK